MTYTVGPKGQVVIAKDIRERLGIGPGWIALQRLVGDHLEVYFLPPAHRESLKGSLSRYIKASPLAENGWDEMREAAWRKAAQQREAAGPEEQGL